MTSNHMSKIPKARRKSDFQTYYAKNIEHIHMYRDINRAIHIYIYIYTHTCAISLVFFWRVHTETFLEHSNIFGEHLRTIETEAVHPRFQVEHGLRNENHA